MPYPGKELLFASVTIAILTNHFAHEFLFGFNPLTVAFGLLAASTAVYQFYHIVIYPHFLSPLRHLPQAPGATLFNGHYYRIHYEPTGEPQKQWINTVANDGVIYYKAILNDERVFVTNVKALSEVLTQRPYDFKKPDSVVGGIGRVLGVGLLLAEGDEHKRQRKLLNPAFTFRHIKDLYPIFWDKARELVLAIEPHAELGSSGEKPSAVVEVAPWTSRAALDIIGVAGMGKDFKAIADPSNELYQTYQRIFAPATAAKLNAILFSLFPSWFVRILPIKRNSDIGAAVKVIKRVAYNLIQDKRQKLKDGESTDVDILSVAINSGGFSDDDLVNQLMTFLSAGHETTASTMTWAILLLCQHPDVQKRLREELRKGGIPSVYDETGTVTSTDFEGIPYLSAVCNEILRVRPPVRLTPRAAAKDTTIAGNFIPKNTLVMLCPVAINHSKELWGEDAMEFNPERWMAPGCQNTGGAQSIYAFMTFIQGARGCIGNSFAKAEFMALLAAWVMTFETELEDPNREIIIEGGVTSRPKGGLPVRITPVEG